MTKTKSNTKEEPKEGPTSYINYTPGRLYQVKLRGKRRAKGLISLYLDYYLGVTKTKEGKSAGIRKYEFLNIYVEDDPRGTNNIKKKEQTLQLALSIRYKREELLRTSIEGIPSPQLKKINFIDYCQNFSDTYKNKDNRLVKCCLIHFNKFIEKKLKEKYIVPSQINEDLVKDFKRYLQDNLNGETPYNYFTKFKKICKQATKERIFINNPADEITMPRPTGVKKEILSFNEINMLSKAYCGNQEVKLAFLFCLNTGLRHIDIKSLKWKHIDFERNQLRKMQSKVEQSSKTPFVYIDLNNNVKAILSCKTKGKPDDLIFTLPSIEGSTKTIKHWVKRAGIEKNITWHCARHSFATNLLINNANIKTVSGLLGHSSLKHTEKYTHLVDELKRKAVDSLPDMQLIDEGKTKLIDENVIELMTAKGFDKLYFEKLKDVNIKTNEEAYNAAEENYKKHFGKNKYSNFRSYRICKNKRLKNNKFK